MCFRSHASAAALQSTGFKRCLNYDLLPFYAILRSIPNKLLGVIAMFGSLLILLILPLTDLSRIRGAKFRPIMKITNTYKENALFLGTNISHSKATTYSLHRKGTLQRNSGFITLNAPMDRIYKKLREAGFMSNHRGRTRVSWLSLEVRQIITLANSIIRGYENYYSFVLNKGQLCSYIYYIIKDTVLRTLANKLSISSRAKVIQKFGPDISLFDQNKRDKENKPTLVTKLYKPSYQLNLWDFKSRVFNTNIKALFASDLSLAKLDNLICTVCGSAHKVEMHHIRAMKDIKHKKGTLDYLMAKRYRKQIPVCRDCHMAHHSGKQLILKKGVKSQQIGRRAV